MTVRLRLALTIVLAGLATAIGVIVTLAVAFQRFDHESAYQRADGFISRVLVMHPDLLDQHQRQPAPFEDFLRSLLLYDPDSHLYLLAPDGRVLARSGKAPLAPGYRVAMEPVRQAAEASARGDSRRAAYVMGDDPEYMQHNTVVAARALGRAQIGPGEPVAGYLYLVCRKPGLPGPRLALFGSSLAGPALASVLAVCLLMAGLAAWIIVTVTRPLRVLSDEVASAARTGFTSGPLPVPPAGPQADDEFGRLRNGFHALLATLGRQWEELRRLDAFRRESVSNLSHDLRSPLTATVACLETLDQRWQADPARLEDHQLVTMALRNTRNAAGLVRSLGDLALLDEPSFQLRPIRLDLAEVLDDIGLRFAGRARQQAVNLRCELQPAVAEVDVELFERAVANLLDNALKYSPPHGTVTLSLQANAGAALVSVSDQGPGIAVEDLPHLFDRLYRGHDNVAPAGSDEGKGLGLAIVKRIVELHGGTVAVHSALGQGTRVALSLPVSRGLPAA
jgi:signal transduction histidine kinase